MNETYMFELQRRPARPSRTLVKVFTAGVIGFGGLSLGLCAAQGTHLNVDGVFAAFMFEGVTMSTMFVLMPFLVLRQVVGSIRRWRGLDGRPVQRIVARTWHHRADRVRAMRRRQGGDPESARVQRRAVLE
jgi:hypothetical protein